MEISQTWKEEVSRQTLANTQAETTFPELTNPIRADELNKAIKAIKVNGKGPDYDGIHPKMLKSSGYQFHINLMILFNSILQTNKWPFTNNVVILIKKPGKKDYGSTANYGPITISSVCGKLLERILETRLRNLTEVNNWLPNYQHGFRKGMINKYVPDTNDCHHSTQCGSEKQNSRNLH